jgi:hypothetical protein
MQQRIAVGMAKYAAAPPGVAGGAAPAAAAALVVQSCPPLDVLLLLTKASPVCSTFITSMLKWSLDTAGREVAAIRLSLRQQQCHSWL